LRGFHDYPNAARNHHWNLPGKKGVAERGRAATFAAQIRHMADQANKYPENVSGKFYVDDQCIDCDLCRETAPANFKRNDDGGHSFLYKQPENPDEEKLCKEAMEGCPVEAIGSDGV
jgi:ferredoxin